MLVALVALVVLVLVARSLSILAVYPSLHAPELAVVNLVAVCFHVMPCRALQPWLDPATTKHTSASSCFKP